MAEIAWDGIWRDVASRLARHRAAGRGHLLTEDVVRMETVMSLDGAGVAASRLTAEIFAAELNGGKLDLTVDGVAGTIIEFKYPRDSRTGISPDTMILGELVRDFIRVAVVTADDRWVVQVLNPRLVKYLLNVQRRHALEWTVTKGQTLMLHPDVLSALPETAVRAIGFPTLRQQVTATCVVAAVIYDNLALYAYQVAAVETTAAIPLPLAVKPALLAVAENAQHSDGSARDGARHEILASARRVMDRCGRPCAAQKLRSRSLRRTRRG